MSLTNRLGLGRKQPDGMTEEARQLEELLFEAVERASPRRAAPTRGPQQRTYSERSAEAVELPRTPPPRPATKKKRDNSDFVVGALGITLGLLCALFPWYIFLNPEQFGVREFVFSGQRSGSSPEQIAYQPQRIGQPFAEGEMPTMQLDFIPTATVPAQDQQQQGRPASAEDQPFPADLVTYQLVHVANGRAMIQDADGLWIVQPGSRLPDASKVASIEQRKGRWVLVTTLDKVIELQN